MGGKCLSLPMTLAEPLLLTDQAGHPLTCMPSLGRSGMLQHQQSSWSSAWAGDISLGWGHQYGIGTSVLDGSPQHLFPPCDPPLPCCWQMGDSPPSPVWGIHLVAFRAGTAPSVLPQPFVSCAVGKTAVTGREQLGPHWLCPLPCVSPGKAQLMSPACPVWARPVPKP